MEKITKKEIRSKVIDLAGWILLIVFATTIVLGARGLIIGDPFTFVYFFIFGGANLFALLFVKWGILEKGDQRFYITNAVGFLFTGIVFYYIYILGLNSNWGIK